MIVDGKEISEEIKKELKDKVSKLSRVPMLVAIQVGSDPATESFLRIKRGFAEEIGIVFEVSKFDENITTEEICDRVKTISEDKLVNGIIVQLPLPPNIDKRKVLDLIPVSKDPDVLSSKSKDEGILNPVVLAINEIFSRNEVSLDDQKIVVIGKGELVGGPVIKWLKSHDYEPLVLTKDDFNEDELKDADIIITGAGVAGLIKKELVKEGVVVVDAGTSESGGEIKGDAESSVSEVASVFTPVPGGVGPIAVAKLFENLINK